MAMRFEDIRKRLLDETIDGIGLYISKKLGDLANEYLAPYTGEYSAPTLKIAVSLLDMILPRIREYPYIGDWLKLIGSDGVRDLVVLLVDKAPMCYAKEESIIRCVNLDTIDTVKVDGTPITGFNLTGSPEDFEIHITKPLTPGVHDLVVTGAKKAFSGKIRVEGAGGASGAIVY